MELCAAPVCFVHSDSVGKDVQVLAGLTKSLYSRKESLSLLAPGAFSSPSTWTRELAGLSQPYSGLAAELR